MDKFENELKSAKNPWIKRIGNYLLSREDLHENLKKENKSLKECFDYILIELSKKCVRDNDVGYAAGDDEELYEMAVHYYDEDDIKVGKKDFKTNADGSADAKKLNSVQNSNDKAKNEDNQKEIDQAVANALEKYKKEEQEKASKKKAEEKKKKEELKAKKEAEKLAKEKAKGQIDIFDMLDDGNV